MVEREEGHVLKVQRPVYFISEVLFDSKARYLGIQKLLYAMLIAKLKLRHYFDAHPMVVVSSSGLGDVINNWESTGRIAKWGLELMGFDITYTPTPRSSAGVLLISPSGDKLRYTLQIHFQVTNNVAKYEALLHGIRATIKLGARCLFIRGDSELVINQVMKESTCHDMKMEAYCEEVQKLEDKFDIIKLHHILWWDNEEVDSLARLASSWKPPPSRVFLDILDAPSIRLKEGKVQEWWKR
ncbi:uncharacterized protein [Miscanthus floridulus]|uniref:uncharacterized protein n=1 Tax=Miscanthus floridulus TaxID=154761 RepID=UPI00345A4C09